MNAHRTSHACAVIRLLAAFCLVAFQTGCTIAPAPEKSPVSSKPDSPIEQILKGTKTLVAGHAPSYLGIVPGVSTRSDVEALRGAPNVTRRYKDYESLHYFSNGQEFFLLKNGVVQAITSNYYTPLVTRGQSVTDELAQKFGDAQTITPTLGSPIRVLPPSGLAFTYRLYQFFIPMPLDEYTKLWGSFSLEYDPFPIILSVDTAGIVIGQTMRSQVEQRIGSPDHIASQDPNSPWLYFLEPDLLGRLDVFFNDREEVMQMDIEAPGYTTYTFGQALQQYGPPDSVQLLPGLDGRKFGSFALLYLKRGLRVSTFCPADSCAPITAHALVVQKLYFQPTTLAEYQQQYSDSEFRQWRGFTE